MPLYQFTHTQLIPATLDQVWDFMSAPANLKEITPGYMRFQIIGGDPEPKMYPGMIIRYKVSPLPGLRLTWVTEITHVRDKEYFVDEQRVGPYAIWHHQHKVQQTDKGVLMTDIVSYKPPMGFIGAIANAVVIRKKLNEIFSYRTRAVEKKFPG